MANSNGANFIDIVFGLGRRNDQTALQEVIRQFGKAPADQAGFGFAEFAESKAEALNTFETEDNTELGGSAAPNLIPSQAGGVIDIIRNYPWTLTNIQNRQPLDIPYIALREYELNESAIKAQLDFYLNALGSAASSGKQATTKPYDELYGRSKPSGWSYVFPYFSDVNMELNTQSWTSPDYVEKAMGAVKGALNDASGSNLLKGTNYAKVLKGLSVAGSFAAGAAQLGLSLSYPVVGNFDRPKMFGGHNSQTITINFPLFNTVTNTMQIGDQLIDRRPVWERNREFLFLFMNQNLFNKKDFITGQSPVFYEVSIPGQFFSPACVVTNFKVENKGNRRVMRTAEDKESIVPDVYDISITLESLVMPSKNLFQAVDTGEALNRVFVTGNVAVRGTTVRTVPSGGGRQNFGNLAPRTPQPQNPNQGGRQNFGRAPLSPGGGN